MTDASLAEVVAAAADAPADDLLGLTAALIAVPSVSLAEGPLVDAVETRVRRIAELDVERVGLNIVARTNLGRERRIVMAGHLDTVPANNNTVPRIEGDVLHGLGAADMKSGVAVLLRLAEEVAAGSRFDCTFVFYEAEEIADEHNGLRKLFADRPDLVAGDFAVLLEPTDLWLEAGCQGSIRLEATFYGRRAHTARPWQGDNAVYRAAPVLQRLADSTPAELEVDGLRFRQALSVVGVHGGVAGNVVPDRCTVAVNRRYAPSLTLEEAEAEVRALLDGADEIALTSISPAAHPNLSHPLVAEFAGLLDLPVRCKLGWTDVARFSAHGVPAVNFGPGDPEVSHTAGEHVTRASVEGCYNALAAFLLGRPAQ
ncbi:MAG TPA: succinyl-diaminopimelate desuccinylase [Acidimicrobiia bacterium]|jgi:succinyl-diaminopimelate desuccinylase|nr:succinyl-diaminopimelate desuccinylase [Acidimicrobiia bacterium]